MQITLISDINKEDATLAIFKSAVWASLPDAKIIDITHHIHFGTHLQAVYHLKSSLYYFPKGSIHIVLVDLFNNLESFLLLAQYKEQYYIAPNNGILTMLLPNNEYTFIKALPIAQKNNMIYTKLIFDTIVMGIKKLYQKGRYGKFYNK